MIPKFRAWYKKNTLPMLCVSLISFDQKFIDACIDKELKAETEMSFDLDDVILMQSTGLFDKNGKEIFEGDVVRMHSGELLPVRLHHGMFKPVCYYVSNVFEKVGNIFENPELTEYPDFREG